jgi:hypothetical protein
MHDLKWKAETFENRREYTLEGFVIRGYRKQSLYSGMVHGQWVIPSGEGRISEWQAFSPEGKMIGIGSKLSTLKASVERRITTARAEALGGSTFLADHCARRSA